MTKKIRYAVVGTGRQGTAAAYDMAKWGNAESILLTDYDLERAAHAAEWVNRLMGREVATSTT
jgi:lysine 6-dehydrogenase